MNRVFAALLPFLFAACSEPTASEHLIELPDQEAIEAARKHIDAKLAFYDHMGESSLGDDCGGYSDVYRLFILRTFSESEVIRIGEIERKPSLTHTVGTFGKTNSTTIEIDGSTLAEFREIVRASPFLSMVVHTGVWGVDTPKYHFEWCSDGNYYAVERDWDDSELAPVFQFLENLAPDE